MFDVYGDEIVLDGHTIGRLEGGWPTLRQKAVNTLLYGSDEFVPREQYKEEIDELNAEIDSLRERVFELEREFL